MIVVVVRRALPADHIVGHAFVEVRDLDIEDAAEFVETACGNPVGATLIFLNLLEGKVQLVAQRFLGHAEQGAAQAQALAHVSIDGVRGAGGHTFAESVIHAVVSFCSC